MNNPKTRLAVNGGPRAVSRPFPVWPEWGETERRALLGVLESGKWWMYAYGTEELGANVGAAARSQVEQFEEELAAFHRIKHGIAVSSGTVALEICMRALKLQPGDEVITTPYTFFATSSCILALNALPVYVDIDPETYNLDPNKIEAAVTNRTRAILPVHFAGELCDMDAILAVARKHNLTVIEDAAQAQGVSLEGGRYAGSWGEAGIFSFQASKCLNCGEGGAILTNSDAFAEMAWSLRHCGRNKNGLWFEHFRLGTNGRMNEFSAALLRAQLGRLDDQNARRMRNASYLYRGLEGIDGLSPIRLHPRAKRRNHYLVMLRFNPDRWSGLSRDEFVRMLAAEGVPCSSGYTFLNFENPIYQELDLSSPRSPYVSGRRPIDYRSYAATCPVAVRACRKEAVWLMQNIFLGDAGHVDMVLEAIYKIAASYHISHIPI
jgi:dTDP-4-amino-4,6-dideoxygalactose transaminase